MLHELLSPSILHPKDLDFYRKTVDGKSPSLACGTTGGKILLHSPHEGSSGGEGGLPPVRLLNFNKKITALAAGDIGAISSL